MVEIETFPFNKEVPFSLKGHHYGLNWPVVYLIEDGKKIYIGETTSAYARSKQHLVDQKKAKLNRIHLISDIEFNKSAALDIESLLIQYMAADEVRTVLNSNGGQRDHEYFEREKYRAKFEELWETLQKEPFRLTRNSLLDLRNTDLFKYSPYKALSEDQLATVEELFEEVKTKEKGTYVVSGKPGTGKTVLATYLMKYLAEHDETKHFKIALVVPMTALRATLKKVFGKVSGLSSQQVIGPADVARNEYDLLIVDEAHRLRQRRNISNFGQFDAGNKKLGLGKEGTELDWILKSSKRQIFFYDQNQTVRPSDVPAKTFQSLDAVRYELVTQMRVEGGEEYITFIDRLLSQAKTSYSPTGYDFRIYDKIDQMVSDIKQKDTEHGLARTVAGYAWPWNTKKQKAEYDIEIDGLRLVWNSTLQNWVNSKNAVNEVGCIHTIQGYDLNYAGVILGPEIYFDPREKKIRVNRDKYQDINGKRSATDESELENYVVNIYKTLLTRGIKGTYVYICDLELREYFKSHLV